MNMKLFATLAVGFVLGLAVSFVMRQPKVQAQEKVAEKAKVGQWEYKVSDMFSFDADKKTIAQLNSLGSDGWEYVGPAPSQKNQTWAGYTLFKRPKR
jgi:hypothetical protein